MRWQTFSPRIALGLATVLSAALACHRGSTPDAYGNFEADEVSVSTQSNGQLMSFTPIEGARLRAGDLVAIVDTSQLALERAQIVAQQQATTARVAEAGRQIGVYEVQRGIALRNYERMQRLFEEHAGPWAFRRERQLKRLSPGDRCGPALIGSRGKSSIKPIRSE